MIFKNKLNELTTFFNISQWITILQNCIRRYILKGNKISNLLIIYSMFIAVKRELLLLNFYNLSKGNIPLVRIMELFDQTQK